MDWVAERIYLAVERKGVARLLVRGVYRLHAWAAFPPKLLIRLIHQELLVHLYQRGRTVWSTKMFDEQLRRDGLG